MPGRPAALSRIASALETVCDGAGRFAAWLTLPMVLVTFVVVVLRYVFEVGWIWLQEVTVYLHAAVFLLAAAYTLGHDEHVRVDVLFRRLGERAQRRINAAGTMLLLLPTAFAVFWFGGGFVTRAWVMQEQSRETGGLPYPWPPLLKTCLLIGFALLVLRAIALLLRAGELRSTDASSGKETRL